MTAADDAAAAAALATAKYRFDFQCIPCSFNFYMLDPINCAPECPECGGPTQLLHATALKTST